MHEQSWMTCAVEGCRLRQPPWEGLQCSATHEFQTTDPYGRQVAHMELVPRDTFRNASHLAHSYVHDTV